MERSYHGFLHAFRQLDSGCDMGSRGAPLSRTILFVCNLKFGHRMEEATARLAKIHIQSHANISFGFAGRTIYAFFGQITANADGSYGIRWHVVGRKWYALYDLLPRMGTNPRW